MTSNRKSELPTLTFKNQKAWATWLDKNHTKSSGIWLRIGKKGSPIKSVSYLEAIEVALCYGWIDGQKEKFDSSSWLQKFTPRGEKSIWSSINRGKAKVLIRSGQMKPAGMKAVELARKNGRWEGAYDSPARSKIPSDFQTELDHNPDAQSFFDTLNRQNRYAILFRIQTAKKAETRARKIEQFIRMLMNQEKLYP